MCELMWFCYYLTDVSAAPPTLLCVWRLTLWQAASACGPWLVFLREVSQRQLSEVTLLWVGLNS